MDPLDALADAWMRQRPGDPGPPSWRPVWQADAACRGVGVEVFFDSRHLDRARRLCAACSVVEACRQTAVANPLGHGHAVWGGSTAEELAADQDGVRRRRLATGCRRGHLWQTDDDVYVDPSGTRTCRHCIRERRARRRADGRRKAA